LDFFFFSVLIFQRNYSGSFKDVRSSLWVRREVEKPEGKRPLGRPRRRWKDNTMMDLQEVGCGGMDWIGRAQDREGGGQL
jgi:hypothetical protein